MQAVVRRDSQLWYDADIINHFDTAGRILIQLHEEIYTWGKQQDQINLEIHLQTAHETSTKTRRLILKILDQNLDEKLINEYLKELGFSTMYWENFFNVPTAVGFYMDSDSCVAEQGYLKNFIASIDYEKDIWLKVESLFSSRYLRSREDWPTLQLQHNFPDALSNMIALTMNSSGSSDAYVTKIMQLLRIFEQPESCRGNL